MADAAALLVDNAAAVDLGWIANINPAFGPPSVAGAEVESPRGEDEENRNKNGIPLKR